jgi:hypothetical protein
MLHICKTKGKRDGQMDIELYIYFCLSVNTKIENGKKNVKLCFFFGIRSSAIWVQLLMDYFVQLNVFLQLYNRMHMHVLQGIDVHYKMNFHI